MIARLRSQGTASAAPKTRISSIDSMRGGKRGLYTPGIVLWHKVGPYRLTREYHRRWHAGHGHTPP